jgi:hypothetical protein
MGNEFNKDIEQLTEAVNTPGRDLEEKKKLPPEFLKNIKKKKDGAKDKDGDGKKSKKKMPDFIKKKIDASKDKKDKKKKESIHQEQTLAEAATPIKLKLSCVILGGDLDSDLNTAIKRGEVDGTDEKAVDQWKSDYWDAIGTVLWAGWKVSGKEVVDKLIGTDYQDGDYSNVFLGEINRGSDKYETVMDRLEFDGFDTEIEQLGMDDVIKSAGKDLDDKFKYLAASVYIYAHPEPEIKAELDHYLSMRELQETFDNVDMDISAFQMGIENKPVHTGQVVYAVERGVREEMDNFLGGIRIKEITGVKATVKLPKAGKPGSRADFDVTVDVYIGDNKRIADGEGKIYADWGVEPSFLMVDSGRIRFKSFLDIVLESAVRGNPDYMTTEEKRRAVKEKK